MIRSALNVALVRAEQDVEKAVHHTHPARAGRDVSFTKLCSRIVLRTWSRSMSKLPLILRPRRWKDASREIDCAAIGGLGWVHTIVGVEG